MPNHELEMDCITLLRKLMQFAEGLIWTPQIFEDVLGWDKDRVLTGLKWLKKKEYIYESMGAYVRTEQGREFYEQSRYNPKITTNLGVWKTEALTGIKQGEKQRMGPDWQRSKITNGVIPKGKPEHNTMQTPEDVLFEKETQHQLRKMEAKAAKMLGLRLREFRKLFDQGLIKICKDNGDGEHLGRFHRKGTGVQNLCVECRRKARGK